MPKRRDKGSGSLFYDASKGAWVGRIELPPGPKGRRQKVVQRKSKADLIKELTRLRKTLEAESSQAPANVFEDLTAADVLEVVEMQDADARYKLEVRYRQ